MSNSTETLLNADGSINEAAVQARAEEACAWRRGTPHFDGCVAMQAEIFRTAAVEEQKRLTLSPVEQERRTLRRQLAALEYVDRDTREVREERLALQSRIASLEAQEAIGVNDGALGLSDMRGLLGTAEDLLWAIDKGYLDGGFRPGGHESGYIAALRRQVQRESAKAGK